MKTILEEQLEKWEKITPSNEDKFPLWFINCKCERCKGLRNSLGMNGDSDLIQEDKPDSKEMK